MSRVNPRWGAPRIHGELCKLEIQVAQSTVARYLVRPSGSDGSCQSWRTFLHNHLHEIVAIDFFLVPTLTFKLLFVFVALSHDRRRILHVNVTQHPTSAWTAQQLREAFAWETAPHILLRDRDGLYQGNVFRDRIKALGLMDTPTAPRSPWQNAYVERAIGTLRLECTDHVIPLGEKHLTRVLRKYQRYYNTSRTHLGPAKDAPDGRPIDPPANGHIASEPILGGLHHRYFRRAA